MNIVQPIIESIKDLARRMIPAYVAAVQDVRNHPTPTRYRRRREFSWIDEKFNGPPSDFKVGLLTLIYFLHIRDYSE